ncbi:MAG TPA: hypothetical protein DEG17_23475 [Cyanobacteria bacterium UBA11149]|nr:hypothetical protein [Cyanobacteria bacterium UBA11367]HBE57585.1 hypothetical protein [Cyanobacteria bacterium UBA11366]HBK63226.1 hypothetical protein [Cyanobacteria bacterium UBA11166]HBR75040.1 hypothetical protein [Cyanobacteria bacterium UBA11159]HBS70278.1 hypothetical protein [Cyanobacteria bacterium UBA11153]HBW91743.1 hypothetical protein [Cyanobacteria bacterium UBA11149]HCA94791.1 hypothetical protein [Cyanobacteria bacterium UBA9226]
MGIQHTSSYSSSDTSTPEISQEKLRSLLSQIEVELANSEVYRRTMAGLQTMLGQESNTAELLVKAVGKEAVRITLDKVAKNKTVIPVNSGEINLDFGKEEKRQLKQDIDYFSGKINLELEINSGERLLDSFELTQSPSLMNKDVEKPKLDKKINKAESAKEQFAQQREDTLRQIGQKLRQARQDRSLSTEQLYRQTLVPKYQIEALENGLISHLPEDVYIRGFIRRLCQALGLDGVAMADSLPIPPDLLKTTVSPWYQFSFGGGLQVTPIHLYLGYTALIAGAVGGLNLMSHQSPSGVSIKSNSVNSPQTSFATNSKKVEAISKPGVQSTNRGVKVGGDIAPPEVLRF